MYEFLSSKFFGYLTNRKTACELWKTYEELFSSLAQSRVMELKLQLQTVKKDSSKVDDYVMKLKNLDNNLGAIKEPISYKDLILYAIYGLNHRYNALFVLSLVKPAL